MLAVDRRCRACSARVLLLGVLSCRLVASGAALGCASHCSLSLRLRARLRFRNCPAAVRIAIPHLLCSTAVCTLCCQLPSRPVIQLFLYLTFLDSI